MCELIRMKSVLLKERRKIRVAVPKMIEIRVDRSSCSVLVSGAGAQVLPDHRSLIADHRF